MEMIHHDPSGNAPMIPRSEVIEILNQIQLLQTRLLIILNKNEPDHFKEAKAREHKVESPSWSSSGTGLEPEQIVRTIA